MPSTSDSIIRRQGVSPSRSSPDRRVAVHEKGNLGSPRPLEERVDLDREARSFTDSSELIIALNDPCEHTPWPKNSAILFPNGCWNDGTQIGRMVLAPRTTQGGFVTSSSTWTLNYVLTGGEFTALKIDLF